MFEVLKFQAGGEPVELLASRALYWPRASALLIADLHLGKAATFRAAGVALPKGSTEDDLSRLGASLDQCASTRLLVLGDFLHGASRDEHWQAQWHRWRKERRALTVGVVGGNHDRALASFDLGIEPLGSVSEQPPFELRHAPGADSGAHVLCGHVHPVVRLPGITGRWPAFVLGARQTILPAFSQFTGGAEVSARESELAVCVRGTIARIRRTQGSD
jgi:uncharacterized protein